MIRRLLILTMAVTMMLLTACAGNSDDIFNYSVSGSAGTFDPQFATNTVSQVVVANTFEGLLVQTEEGDLEPGVAHSMSLSPDGKLYTFTLRKDAKWSDGSSVTAHDFVYAFKRIFGAQAISPFAGNFISISGAQEIMNGMGGVENLGVSAKDDFTFQIQLVYPDPSIPTALSQTYAAPCRQSFFEEQKGRYGVDNNSLIYNGPFVIKSLNSTKSINLRKNFNYISDRPVEAAGVNLNLMDSDAIKTFLDGDSDVVRVDQSKLQMIGESELHSFNDTTWVIVYNQQREHLQNVDVRRALSAAIDAKAFTKLPDGMSLAQNVVPNVAFISGKNYRSLAGNLLTGDELNDEIIAKFNAALEELGSPKFPLTEFVVLEDANMRRHAGVVQGQWQDGLNVHINVMPLDKNELLRRVNSGKFDIALLPISMQETTVQSMLNSFSAERGTNVSGYVSEEYARLLKAAGQEHAPAKSAEMFKVCEQLLIDDAVVVPLFSAMSYYAVNPSVDGLRVYPYGERLYFKYAVRK